jgi:hypothetical protein
MAYLEYGQLPETVRVRRSPDEGHLYDVYVPLVEEFFESGRESARVVDDDVEASKLSPRVYSALNKAKLVRLVRNVIRNGEVWLVRR